MRKEKQNVVLVELYSASSQRSPRYAIGVETILDDGAIGEDGDESEKLRTRYGGTDVEVYHALLTYRRSDSGLAATERTFKRLS